MTGEASPTDSQAAAHGGHEAVSVEFRVATKRYAGQSEAAVRELSLEVEAGEICVLVGPSGCGKTTAMRMVNRTVEISEGDILVGGTSVRERDPARLRRETGYVIQQIGLFPHRTIAENIATVPGLVGWDGERTRRRIAELLELIGLDPDSNALLLRNHGVVTAGRTVEEAVFFAIHLEQACKMQLMAELCGGAKFVTGPEEAKTKANRLNNTAAHSNVFEYLARCCKSPVGTPV